MALQDDKEIRSRSVGDGLFKKILIYKPGKPNSGGNTKKRPQSRGRRGKGNKPASGNSENE
jgi:spoIIIJ-associated protein